MWQSKDASGTLSAKAAYEVGSEMKQIDAEGQKVFRKPPQWRQKGCLKTFTGIADAICVQGRFSCILHFSSLWYK